MLCTLALPASWAEGARSEQTHEADAEIAAAFASNPTGCAARGQARAVGAGT